MDRASWTRDSAPSTRLLPCAELRSQTGIVCCSRCRWGSLARVLCLISVGFFPFLFFFTSEINREDFRKRVLTEQPVDKRKRRSYAQVHLEFGQSDFLLRTCSACGYRYTPGNELDGKSHATFHKNYTLGLPFKVRQSEFHVPVQVDSSLDFTRTRNWFPIKQGWSDERLVGTASKNGGRVVLVLDGDPRPRRNKVCNYLRV